MIYDCFPFFNELELLELRLHELDSLVDKFVLVEATKTFTGHPKPLHFAENRGRFSAFADKIIHVVVEDMPEGDGPRDHWVRDRHQRNAIGRGLLNCRPDDIIMVSDLDEIIKVPTIEKFITSMVFKDDFFSNTLHKAFNSRLTRFIFHRKTLRHILRKWNPFVWRLEQYSCGKFLNRANRNKWWYGTTIMHYRDFSIAEEMRYSGHKILKDGGWHFSWMGGASKIKVKMDSWAHQERNHPENFKKMVESLTMEKIKQELEQGAIEILALEKLPKFIQSYPEKFSSWMIDPALLNGR